MYSQMVCAHRKRWTSGAPPRRVVSQHRRAEPKHAGLSCLARGREAQLPGAIHRGNRTGSEQEEEKKRTTDPVHQNLPHVLRTSMSRTGADKHEHPVRGHSLRAGAVCGTYRVREVRVLHRRREVQDAPATAGAARRTRAAQGSCGARASRRRGVRAHGWIIQDEDGTPGTQRTPPHHDGAQRGWTAGFAGRYEKGRGERASQKESAHKISVSGAPQCRSTSAGHVGTCRPQFEGEMQHPSFARMGGKRYALRIVPIFNHNKQWAMWTRNAGRRAKRGREFTGGEGRGRGRGQTKDDGRLEGTMRAEWGKAAAGDAGDTPARTGTVGRTSGVSRKWIWKEGKNRKRVHRAGRVERKAEDA
ncbi:hypothetical protein C8J57DRAFT_1254901 [Mycena rebaudengoi]|nr:hypothetical protein C8J57DRAFT_1254901 [Mycena rebaudengoi]